MPINIESTDMKNFIPAKKRINVSVGESVRTMRELQELSQAQLSERCGIAVAEIMAIETDSASLGIEHAKILARALHCHPAMLIFPGWELEQESAA
ncbi:helix-turn-helix transcriptional regulator [Rugamonas sp.]|uniref:helix-turn-helix domain-containing protein n=1 Tax=Rugamonas sp. TaxID=1926287 RepID=UPI0025E72130|nr:helix-turn-helix transcriptional regulator [Rugamonas sp.]